MGVIFKLNRACVLGNLIFSTLLHLRVPDFPTCQHLQSPASKKNKVSDFQKNPHGWPGGWKDGHCNGRTGRVHWAGRIKNMWCAQTAMWKFFRLMAPLPDKINMTQSIYM